MKQYLTISEVAERFGVHRNTINNWLETTNIPKPIKIGERYLRWLKSDIDEYEATLKERD